MTFSPARSRPTCDVNFLSRNASPAIFRGTSMLALESSSLQSAWICDEDNRRLRVLDLDRAIDQICHPRKAI